MRRRVFFVLASISLLMCLASMWIWHRSEEVADRIIVTHETSAWVVSAVSHLWFSYVTLNDSRPEGTEFRWTLNTRLGEELYPGDGGHHYFLGFTTEAYAAGFDATTSDGTRVHRSGVQHMLGVPCWFFVAVFAILTALARGIWLRSSVRRSRSLCSVCGYDLRATPQRCPECGNVAVPSEQFDEFDESRT